MPRDFLVLQPRVANIVDSFHFPWKLEISPSLCPSRQLAMLLISWGAKDNITEHALWQTVNYREKVNLLNLGTAVCRCYCALFMMLHTLVPRWQLLWNLTWPFRTKQVQKFGAYENGLGWISNHIVFLCSDYKRMKHFSQIRFGGGDFISFHYFVFLFGNWCTQP